MTDLERLAELEAKLDDTKAVLEVWDRGDTNFVAERSGRYCQMHRIDLTTFTEELAGTAAFARVLINYARLFIAEREKK